MSFLSSLEKKIIEKDNIESVRSKIEGKKLVFTNGCFDLIHPGHVEYLSRARLLGDYLWLGLNSDLSVKRLKGENRPINTEKDRAIVLAGLSCIDWISIFQEDTPENLITLIRPSIHTKGGDYLVDSLPETKLVRSLGGEVIILPFLPGKSTTNLLEKAKRY